jgi:hypothetical protein
VIESKATWIVSVRMIVSIIASTVVILGAALSAVGACVGLYYGLANRVTIIESSQQHLSDDVKDIKAMLSQFMLNRSDSHSDLQRWPK